ncbi:hypothetical protein CYY_006914 [Polysphondylium violaceum]|uniref:non-specific serine/threonine protein kinase n=1 Tax=Polysphondylium violaceum TaxID=133409 RepID=A0A8J4PQJ3_9MYCE|nr:hypothetical protein CYY_006914 [Polysphondylium violaceum]
MTDHLELKQLSLDDDEYQDKTNTAYFNVDEIPHASELPPLNGTSDRSIFRESMCVAKQQIGSYVIGEQIGKGGFASVFKGLNTLTGDFVAIKRFDKSRISKEQLSSISTELDLLQRLKHESIVTILGQEENEHYIFIFLEFMENGSLATILNNFGTFPESLICTYVDNVLKGLAYLHSEGVIHRDIKAANILINKAGDAKLSDFGVAGEIKESDKRYSVVGTPYWMAPEVIEISGSVQVSDIWSIGCTIIELLTSTPPYFNLNPMSAMFRIVQDDKPPFPKNISNELLDFLDRCFCKNIEERATAKELLSHPWITKNRTILIHHQRNSSFKQHQQSFPSLDQISKTISVFVSTNDDSENSSHNTSRSSSFRDDDDDSKTNTIAIRPTATNHQSSSSNSPTTNKGDNLENKKAQMEISLLKLKNKELEGELKKESEKLIESEKKYKEILLSAMHYIYIVDSTMNITGGVKQTISDEVAHLRTVMRDQIEIEYFNAFPDDNMVPRFIQRRLTRDTLIHIPKKALEAQKRREKEEKKKEKKDKDKKDKDKKDKDKEKKKSPDSSIIDFSNSSSSSSSNSSSNLLSPTSNSSSNNNNSRSPMVIGKRTTSKNQINITNEINQHITNNVKLTPPTIVNNPNPYPKSP